jgi:hypothetical protein
MTARYTEQQMTTTQIDLYINLFYTLHFPEQFKNTKLTKPYIFTTIPNVDTYDFVYENDLVTDAAGNDVSGNIQLSPPVYCQGYLLKYYQDNTLFYNRWPKLSVNQIIGTCNGIGGFTYTGTIPPFPFLRAQLDIFGNVTESAVIISTFDDSGFNYAINDQPLPDNNLGNLVDDAGNIVGAINYLTGAYQFTPFAPIGGPPVALPAGDVLYASVVPYQASRPIAALFYNQQIVLRPVPAQVYQIEFQISKQPTQLLASNQAPELDEWYQFICAGASKLIYADFPDPEGMQYLMPIWQEQLQIAQRRTLRQLSSQRVNTIFSSPGNGWNGLGMSYGSEYSGGF